MSLANITLVEDFREFQQTVRAIVTSAVLALVGMLEHLGAYHGKLLYDQLDYVRTMAKVTDERFRALTTEMDNMQPTASNPSFITDILSLIKNQKKAKRDSADFKATEAYIIERLRIQDLPVPPPLQ
ncbi:hypothetical protein F503_03964 [Ophiostoma piceae UAMH 11346]|uniref:Uncharacterized protein n=1 Tax=Ophiostoma piceae (strain UAMH 11346) TaxID=1262450 RepID=S3BME0_OPHP1|nr:hypothetical protein F503_03964 [Ophiostoma piceae UAMH 11346]